jgi:hypothetical protein
MLLAAFSLATCRQLEIAICSCGALDIRRICCLFITHYILSRRGKHRVAEGVARSDGDGVAWRQYLFSLLRGVNSATWRARRALAPSKYGDA